LSLSAAGVRVVIEGVAVADGKSVEAATVNGPAPEAPAYFRSKGTVAVLPAGAESLTCVMPKSLVLCVPVLVLGFDNPLLSDCWTVTE